MRISDLVGIVDVELSLDGRPVPAAVGRNGFDPDSSRCVDHSTGDSDWVVDHWVDQRLRLWTQDVPRSNFPTSGETGVGGRLCAWNRPSRYGHRGFARSRETRCQWGVPVWWGHGRRRRSVVVGACALALAGSRAARCGFWAVVSHRHQGGPVRHVRGVPVDHLELVETLPSWAGAASRALLKSRQVSVYG
jgi:hypothetical protein